MLLLLVGNSSMFDRDHSERRMDEMVVDQMKAFVLEIDPAREEESIR